MRVHHLEYNGRQYEYGTIVKIKYGKEIEAAFYVCDPEEDYYMFAVKDNKCKDGYFYFTYTKKKLKENLIEITEDVNTTFVQWNPIRQTYTSNGPTFKEEMRIDGMFIAWVWYVFLIGVTLFFNGQIFYWAFISFIFFDYRKKKLREEGYK